MTRDRLVMVAVVGALAVFAFSGIAFMGGTGGKRYAPLFTVLDGNNEIDDEGRANAGDPDGRGSAMIFALDADTVCFSIIVNGIDKPVAAHIHEGRPGVNGPPVVTLVAPKSGNAGTSSGCVNGVAKSIITNLERESGNFYINVHTGKFPGGALRGQLF